MNRQYLIENARRAVNQLRHGGVGENARMPTGAEKDAADLIVKLADALDATPSAEGQPGGVESDLITRVRKMRRVFLEVDQRMYQSSIPTRPGPSQAFIDAQILAEVIAALSTPKEDAPEGARWRPISVGQIATVSQGSPDPTKRSATVEVRFFGEGSLAKAHALQDYLTEPGA